MFRYDTSLRSRIFLPPMLFREAINSEASLTSFGQVAGIEPIASQVFHLGHSGRPRKRLRTIALTTELHPTWSGRPGSNRPPEAWKATALPNELLPLIIFYVWPFEARMGCGQGWIRTTELRRGQIYSLLPLATWLLARPEPPARIELATY